MKKSLIIIVVLLLGASFSLSSQVIARTQFEAVFACDPVEAGRDTVSGTETAVFLPILMFNPPVEVTFAQEVVNQTNSYRTLNGCPPLLLNPNLNAAAQRHSDDMASHDFMAHTGSDGSTPWLRMQEAGYSFSSAAENIAAGYGTPEDVVAAWMNSARHRDNILNCALNDMGVGYSENNSSQYRRYWTQNLGRSQ